MGTIDSFERSMVMLAHRSQSRPESPGTLLLPPPPRSHARSRIAQRRRLVLGRLAGGVGATGLLAVVVGGAAWALFLLAVAALGAYIAMVFQIEARQAEMRRKVRAIRSAQTAAARQPLDLHELAVAEQGGSG